MDIIDLYNDEYCFGVKNALNIIKENSYKNYYILGKLVHNSYVQEEIKSKNINEIDNLKTLKLNDSLIITAHGTTKKNIDYLKNNNINIIDATCPIIKNIKSKILNYLDKDYKIFYIGKKNHTETKGIISYSNDIYLIEKVSDLNLDFKNEKIYVVNQTTLKIEDLNLIHEYIKNNFKNAIIENTICSETIKRQNIIKNHEKLDLVIVVGDKTSSNCNELYELAKIYHNKAIFIESYKELFNKNFNNYKKIGIISGTSTPNFLKKEIINYLNNI